MQTNSNYFLFPRFKVKVLAWQYKFLRNCKMKNITLLSIMHYYFEKYKEKSDSLCWSCGRGTDVHMLFLVKSWYHVRSHACRAFEFWVMRSATGSRSSLMFVLTNVVCCWERYGVLWSLVTYINEIIYCSCEWR